MFYSCFLFYRSPYPFFDVSDVLLLYNKPPHNYEVMSVKLVHKKGIFISFSSHIYVLQYYCFDVDPTLQH